VSTGEEGTSNNKVKERDIHLFLRKVLGNNVPGSAPYPEWGLPEGSIHVGWGGYLAGEARRCMRKARGPGRGGQQCALWHVCMCNRLPFLCLQTEVEYPW
jgi:hypothetical protein